jgi:hypothetical protein
MPPVPRPVFRPQRAHPRPRRRLAQISPEPLESQFWRRRERSRLSLDYFIALLALVADIPIMIKFWTGWQVPSLQLLAHGIKLAQLRLCSRWLLDPRSDYRNWRRSALVISERLIRCLVILLVSTEFDKSSAQQAAAAAAPAPYRHAALEAAAALLGRVKTLVYGSGTYGAWWHTMLNPVPWLLEVPMLLLMVYFSLRDRIPSTASVFDGSSAPVRWMEHAFRGLSR